MAPAASAVSPMAPGSCIIAAWQHTRPLKNRHRLRKAWPARSQTKPQRVANRWGFVLCGGQMLSQWATRRKRPYTTIGIRRLLCIRCHAPPSEQWSACADRNNWRPLCIGCDVELNRMVLEWMGHPNADKAMDEYIKRKLGPQ